MEVRCGFGKKQVRGLRKVRLSYTYSVVIFPILEKPENSNDPVSAWKAVEEKQRQTAEAYWLVTQPSHAALAGELAAALRDDLFGRIDATVGRSIALHDAGWSMEDAEQIQRLRADLKQKPTSFVQAAPGQFLRAWTGSIETVEKFSPLGGYLVSRHFERISLRDDPKDQAKLETFRAREKQRQQKLRASLRTEEAALEKLVDAVQFCDLLSLYLCCGSSDAVKFDKPDVTLSRRGEEYTLTPSAFREHRQFSFSALRHPADSGKKGQSGATFYINL